MASLKYLYLLILGLIWALPCKAETLVKQRAEQYFKPGSFVVEEKARDNLKSPNFKKVDNLYPEGAFLVVPSGLNVASAKDLDLDDYDTPHDKAQVYDPLEGWNRFWFNFNDKFFIYVAKPVYRGWEYITPKAVRTGLKNFFHNALFPVRFVNNLLQFRLKAAGVEFSKFMMNTMCSAGFADPASKKKPLVEVDDAGEDFGQTLGVWGIGHGPYLVWPFIGPSSLRDTLGRIGDMFAEPTFYLEPWYAAWSISLGLRFNNLDEVLPLYDDLVGAAIDPYISMREAYINYRNFHVNK